MQRRRRGKRIVAHHRLYVARGRFCAMTSSFCKPRGIFAAASVTLSHCTAPVNVMAFSEDTKVCVTKSPSNTVRSGLFVL